MESGEDGRAVIDVFICWKDQELVDGPRAKPNDCLIYYESNRMGEKS
jgi:hypothetical protein